MTKDRIVQLTQPISFFQRKLLGIPLFRKKAFKDSLAIFGVQISIKPISFIRGLVVAKFLGPADYGILKGVELDPKERIE